MSMITEQVKELDECAKKCQQYPFINVCMNNEGHDFRFIFRNAADTIKTLSEKVRAANMERSTAYYNGGWIPTAERLPEEYGEYFITWTTSESEKPLLAICECEITNEFDYKNKRFKVDWLLDEDIEQCLDVKVTAWMPLPEPYREDGTE